jgi:hypothetical protein
MLCRVGVKVVVWLRLRYKQVEPNALHFLDERDGGFKEERKANKTILPTGWPVRQTDTHTKAEMSNWEEKRRERV